MKRIYILFLAASCILSSCNMLSNNMAEKEIAKLQFAVPILSLLALGASIASIVMLRRRTSRDAIIEEVLHSKRVRVFIEKISEEINSNSLKEIKTQVQSSTRSINVDSEIRKALESPLWKNYFSGLLKLRESPSGYKDNTLSSIQQKPDKTEGQAEQKSAEKPNTVANVPRVELFARDTPSLELTGVSSSYQPGKSIFKLVLNSNESSTANIEICSDKPEVLLRIIQSDQDLIEPVCKIASKVNKPSDIKWTAGKAEKVDADTWKVCEQVIVEYK